MKRGNCRIIRGYGLSIVSIKKKPDYPKRNQMIAKMLEDGYSLADIGAEFKLSRERVRQIGL